MKRLLIMIPFLLLLSAGCISDNATHGQANGGYATVTPSSLVLGYGSFSFMHMNIVLGQGMHYHSDQYGMTSSNLWYSEDMTITPLVNGQITVTHEQKPLLMIPGLRIDNPFSNPVTTVEMAPNFTSTNSVSK